MPLSSQGKNRGRNDPFVTARKKLEEVEVEEGGKTVSRFNVII